MSEMIAVYKSDLYVPKGCTVEVSDRDGDVVVRLLSPTGAELSLFFPPDVAEKVLVGMGTKPMSHEEAMSHMHRGGRTIL